MQVVNGYICLNCSDVDRARKFVDPAAPQTASSSQAKDLREKPNTQREDAVRFGGSLSPANSLQSSNPSAPNVNPKSLVDIYT